MMNTLGQGSGRIRGENIYADELEDNFDCTASPETLMNIAFVIESYKQFGFPEPRSKNWKKHIKNTREYFKDAPRAKIN